MPPMGAPPAQPGASQAQPGAGAGAGADASGENPFAQIQNNPMFDQLRERIIQDPSFFQ